MSIALQQNPSSGTDRFNHVQLQLASEGRCAPPRTRAAETGLLRVLVVDDDRDTADVMALLVGRWGHEAQRAYDGATALGTAARQVPDVVLLDLAMPRMDGCQVAERLRGDERLRNCFLIALTGHTDPANRLRCREAGIDLFLFKPVETSVLETLLDLECTRLGRSRPDRGRVGVSRRISAVEQWAIDPWKLDRSSDPPSFVAS